MTFDILTSPAAEDGVPTLTLANTVDAQSTDLAGVQRVTLDFPKFTDGRAFSQAFVLRRRGFSGDIRATGDVLIDQLLQMQRSGFSSAVLRADQNAEYGRKLLSHYAAFYQGDAAQRSPHFTAKV